MRTLYNIVMDGLTVFSLLTVIGVAHLFVEPSIRQVTREGQSWYATPTATPVPVPLDITPDDETAARKAYYV